MGSLAGTTIHGLMLKDLNIDQTEGFFAHVEENREIYADTIPFVSGVLSVEEMRERISLNLKRVEEGISELYTLWDGARMAGYFLVREKDADAGWAEIGYMIGREWQGKGISKQICQLLITDLFRNQGMQKVVICCSKDNAASIGLAKSLGFQLEGDLRRHIRVNGKVHNLLYFGLLKEEWTAD